MFQLIIPKLTRYYIYLSVLTNKMGMLTLLLLSKHQFIVFGSSKIHVYKVQKKDNSCIEHNDGLFWMTMYAYSNHISLSLSATYQLRQFRWPHGILYRIAETCCLPCWGTWLVPAHVLRLTNSPLLIFVASASASSAGFLHLPLANRHSLQRKGDVGKRDQYMPQNE